MSSSSCPTAQSGRCKVHALNCVEIRMHYRMRSIIRRDVHIIGEIAFSNYYATHVHTRFMANKQASVVRRRRLHQQSLLGMMAIKKRTARRMAARVVQIAKF